MARALFWEEAKPGNKVDTRGVDPMALTEAHRKLNETFGKGNPRGIELNKSSVFTLRQMGGPVFSMLADLVDQNGTIRIWGQE